MGALRSTALLLLLLAGLLRGCGSSVHSMRHFFTAVSEPGQELPSFVAGGYVDGQCFARYDSHTRRVMPAAPWMEKVTQEDPRYWDRNTDFLRGAETLFRGHLPTLRERYNQSAGLHTWQLMFGCDLNEHLPSGGFIQYGYEGRDFLAFDKETLTWTAADPPAGISKRKLDAESGRNAYLRTYLEEECIERLRKFLRYGNQTLLRKVKPQLKISPTEPDSPSSPHTLLVCTVGGFFPAKINVTWLRNGQEEDDGKVVSTNVIRNGDWTFRIQVMLEAQPKRGDVYTCQVEHASLPSPASVQWEPQSESARSKMWTGVAGLLLGLVFLLPGLALFLKKKKKRGPAIPPPAALMS